MSFPPITKCPFCEEKFLALPGERFRHPALTNCPLDGRWWEQRNFEKIREFINTARLDGQRQMRDALAERIGQLSVGGNSGLQVKLCIEKIIPNFPLIDAPSEHTPDATTEALHNLFQACSRLPVEEMERMEKEINAASAALKGHTETRGQKAERLLLALHKGITAGMDTEGIANFLRFSGMTETEAAEIVAFCKGDE